MKEHDPDEVHVGLVKVKNGYLIRYEKCTYVFTSFDDAVAKVKVLFCQPRVAGEQFTTVEAITALQKAK